MKTSSADLRYKIHKIHHALERNETFTLVNRGKLKETIHPADRPKSGRIMDHPFFGMYKNDEQSVIDELDKMRKPRPV